MIKEEAKILTMMFIDIVGYTKTTSELKRETLHQLHDVFDSISLSVFEEFSGKVINKVGDAYLATFKSATEAVLCGIELQKQFKEYNREYKPAKKLKIRVALHTGEVVTRDHNIFGDAVNTAARIESIAKSGDIVFSETVYHAMNKNEIPYIYLGQKKLKGLKRPLKIFRVKKRKGDLPKPKKGKFRRFIRKLISRILVAAVIAGLVYLLVYLIQGLRV
jgi:class 3 adenylate cyclase